MKWGLTEPPGAEDDSLEFTGRYVSRPGSHLVHGLAWRNELESSLLRERERERGSACQTRDRITNFMELSCKYIEQVAGSRQWVVHYLVDWAEVKQVLAVKGSTSQNVIQGLRRNKFKNAKCNITGN
jgi:hypothetical protein